MAKLKCDAHKRRVVAIGLKFVHRSDIGDGNGTKCDSQSATMPGGIHFTPYGIATLMEERNAS